MKNTEMSLKEIASALRKYAARGDVPGGWDYLVETYDNEEFLAEAQEAAELTKAIAKISPLLHAIDNRRKADEATG